MQKEHAVHDTDAGYANPAARDAFLRALDGDDRVLAIRLARDLLTCGNLLPGMTRDELGLQAGATYGAAARHILSLDQSCESAPTAAGSSSGD